MALVMCGCNPQYIHQSFAVPVELEARLHDVSLPLYREVKYHEVSDENATLVEGISPLLIDDIVSFYEETFERDGWHCVMCVQSEGFMQFVWMRPSRIAVVTLESLPNVKKRASHETRFFLSVNTQVR